MMLDREDIANIVGTVVGLAVLAAFLVVFAFVVINDVRDCGGQATYVGGACVANTELSLETR